MGVYGTISIEQIGSYAGFAAVLGLAVLSALYFSQARDVKRLREWAGRAPERDAEARARVAAATAAGQQRQAGAAQPAAGAQPAAAPQPATANSGNNSGGATATPAQEPAVASKAPAVAGGTAAAASGGPAPAGGVAAPARPLGVAGSRPASGRTSILTPQDEPRQPWYRRIAPRYIALIVAGVLVVGGGIAVGVVQLLSSDDSGGGGGGGQSQPAAQTGGASNAAITAGDISVAVLNATPVQGLANQFGDRAQAEGFKKDNVGNAPGGQQRAESVVLFAPGKEREARLVRRKFNVSNIEPVDPESQALAPQADVILVVGADNTQ